MPPPTSSPARPSHRWWSECVTVRWGILFVLSWVCFLAGVLDPPILPTRAVGPPMPWPPPRHTGGVVRLNRRPALRRRTRRRVLRPTGTGRYRLPRPGDTANPRTAHLDGLRSPDRYGPASRPVRRIPWCAAVPAVPRLHRDRHRGTSLSDASNTGTDPRTCPPDPSRAARHGHGARRVGCGAGAWG